MCYLASFIIEIQARQTTGLLPSKHARRQISLLILNFYVETLTVTSHESQLELTALNFTAET